MRARAIRLGANPASPARGAARPRPHHQEQALSTTTGIILGYDPATLHERVDLAAAGRRLDELGRLRSLSALIERTELLRLVERIDDAWDAANEAVRLARFTADRQDLLTARIHRARVAHARERSDDAVIELNGCADEAGAQEWADVESDAVHARGLIAFDRRDYAQALADFTRAVFLREKTDATKDEVESALIAVAVAESFLDEGGE